MMASAAAPPVNGGLALDFGEAKGLETSELGSSGPNTDSPGSHMGFEDYPPANESPYQEMSAEEEESTMEIHEKQCFGNDEKSENIESLLQPPAAKKRRKQSNPVRIASSRVIQTVETADEQHDGPLNLAPVEMADSSSSPPTLHALYRCPHCSAVFDVEDHLRIHVEEEHVQKLLEKQLQHQGIGKPPAVSEDGVISTCMANKEMDSALDMSLPYHNVMHESKDGILGTNGPVTSTISHLPPPLLTPENKDTPVSMASALVASGTFGSPPFLIPLLSQGPSPSQPMSNTGPPIRIFNPEAYCEICNKEFCNKYFLKTHKANKHGIYSMEALAGSPYAGAFLTANMNAAALSMRSLLGTSSAPVTPSTESLSATLAKSSGPLNADAYCEICQKEFCNKYFLRKHKQKIHGIFEPPTTPMTPTQAHGMNGVSGGTNISPASTLDSPISNGSFSSVTSVTTTNNFESVCEMCNKDFGSRSQLQNHKYVVHGTPPSVSTSVTVPSSLGGPLYTTSNSVSQNEDGFLVQRLDNKPGLGFFTPERLREIGVINAEAFCEICCKEFCNKYFLRTHKQNKHGAPMSEQGLSKSLSTSPITLVPQALEKGSNGEEGRQSTTPKMGSGPSLAGEPKKENEESADLSCNVCGRPFASVYLLKMHKFYSHNIQPCEKEPPESAALSVNATTTHLQDTKVKEESTQENAENLVKNERLDPPGEDLRKLQSMIQELNAPTKENLVSCTICRKDMENKYFLRAHMMNEHGILHSEDNVTDAFMKSTNMSKDQNFLNRYPFLSHPPPTDSDTSCDICKKDFGTKYFLHIHKTNAHGIPMDLSMPPVSIGSELPPASSSSVIHSLCSNPESMPAPPNTPSDRPTVITGRNYCEICNKELCNKYFMKTHMLKMHGINIEDRIGIKGAAIIGGVTCDICQKELCSKYFLKVHKQNTHGIFEESPSGKENSRLSTPDKEAGLMPGEVTDDNSRYFSHYTEVCPICDRRFKSIKWLKTHMVNDHSDHLKENGITISPQSQEVMSKTCPACGKFFSDAVTLQVHMIHHHYSSQGGEMQGFGDSVAAKQLVASTQGEGDTHDVGSVCSQNTRLGPDGLPHKRTGNGTRIYHCSYCSYATRWLSNLYAHEKRHTGLANEGEKKFPCRLCPRAYRYNHSLQRHLLSHRGALSRIPTSESLAMPALLPHQSNGNGEGSGHMQLPLMPRRVRKFRCSKCLMKFRSRKFCQAHIRDVHGTRLRMPLVTATFQKGIKLFKCRRCGFLTRHLNILKQHIRQQHRDIINPSIPPGPAVSSSSNNKSKPSPQNESLHGDALKPANDQMAASVATTVITTATTTSTSPKTAQNSPGVQIPMTYAMPQNPPSAGSFIMQPFLMAQPLVENVGPKAYGTFVPSLVYLPVCQKVSEPVTIAFTLTPA